MSQTKASPVLFTFLGALVISVLTYLSVHPESIAQTLQKGMLWQITKQGTGTAPSYLLGTIHSEDPRITNLPKIIQTTLDKASSFSGELEMNVSTIIEMSKAMFFSDGSDLKSVVGERLFKQSMKLLKGYNIPRQYATNMKPWAVILTLNMPKSKTNNFLDLILYNKAHSQGKSVYGLETAAEQIGYFDTLPLSMQINMLEDSVSHHHQMPDLLEKMIQAYLARDLNTLKFVNDKFLHQSGKKIAHMFMQRFVIERNQLMTERMQPRLREGNAFIAVGALHLPGEKGILKLLTQRGYRVRPIY